MDDEELFPTDFEAVLGVLTFVIREERDVENRIARNTQDVTERFQKEVLSKHGAGPAVPPQSDAHAAETSDAIVCGKPPPCEQPQPSPAQPSQPQPSPPQPSPPHEQPHESPNLEFPEETEKELTPLVKKLFKPIAIQCHPDKVADAKLNKLFLIGRKAYNEGDVPTLLFVLTKFPSAVELDEAEMAEVKGYIDKRQAALMQKRDTFAYKWGFMREEDKQRILEHIQFSGQGPPAG